MLRELGQTGTFVFPVGFGGMPLSREGRPPRTKAVSLLRAAARAGISLIDTADIYCKTKREIGHNERLIRQAFGKSISSDAVVVATKGGLLGPGRSVVDASPKHLRAACERSLSNLGVDSIFLYQLHSLDPRVNLEKSIAELIRLRNEGKIRNIGLCNVTLAQLRRVSSICPVASVQNSFNPIHTADLTKGLIDFCESRQISYMAHSPFAGWLFHKHLAANPVLGRIARRHETTTYAVTLAWILSKGSRVLLIPGTSCARHMRENVRDTQLRLSARELSAIDSLGEK